MDMFIPIALLFFASRSAFHQASIRTRIKTLAVLLLPNLAYGIFRWVYFKDVLPNTYYLKMTGTDLGVRLLRGLDVFVDFAQPIWPLFFAGALAVASMWKSSPIARWMGAIVLAQFLYSIWIGGDAWEWSKVGANRFNCVVMPLVFTLIAVALELNVAALKSKSVALIATALIVLMSNGILARDWKPHFENLTLRRPPLQIPAHRRVLRDVLALDKIVPPNVRVAVVWAGIPAFFSHFQLVDLMGYNDRIIAKGPMHGPPTSTIPASFFRDT
jgi:hypothetical protein